MVEATRSARGAVALVAGLLLVAGIGLGVPAGAQEAPNPVVEESRQVTDDPRPARLYVIPEVAVHPEDPSTVVVASGEYRYGGCHLFVSRDGGLSFTTTAQFLPEGYDFCMRRPFYRVVDAAFTPSGDRLYIGMGGSKVAAGHPNGPSDALFASTADLGQTVNTSVVFESREVEATGPEGQTDTVGEQHDHASIAVDPTNPDRVYYGWRRQTQEPAFSERTGFPRGIASVDPLWSMVAVSEDGGQTWSEPVNLTTGAEGELPQGSDVAEVVVGNDGTAYAFTRERRSDEEPNRLFMFRSTDNGRTWTGGVVHEGAQRLNNPAAAVDRDSGDLYVVWEHQGAERSDPRNVLFTTSSDGGDTWQTPVNIIDPEARDSFNQYYPGISVAPDGRIDVAWWDFRNDPFFQIGAEGAHDAGEQFADIYYAHSTDGGRTWSKNMRVSDRSQNVNRGATFPGANRGPIGIASSNDAAYVTWPDTRSADSVDNLEDAYFSRIRMEPAVAAATTSTGVTAVGVAIGAGAALLLAGLVVYGMTRGGRRPRPARQPARGGGSSE